MAKVTRTQSPIHEFKINCDIPACLERRQARGQATGRYLATVSFEGGAVTVTLKCSECGATHAITFQIPPESMNALGKKRMEVEDDA